ncbi:hypothetical protein KCP77_10120 [Salmonella enterica subsp. enterica]|nr:hypothetical protein KCP77_10120 [Salmonella enterica subsp. enterica]
MRNTGAGHGAVNTRRPGGDLKPCAGAAKCCKNSPMALLPWKSGAECRLPDGQAGHRSWRATLPCCCSYMTEEGSAVTPFNRQRQPDFAQIQNGTHNA